MLPIVLLLALAQSPPGSEAESPGQLPSSLQGVGIDQRLGEQLPLDLEFRDEAGRPVKLGDYFNQKKPVILVLAYYRCPMLCTLVLNGLVDSLNGIRFDAGDQFEVVTVSFDPRDTPHLAAAKKKAYMDRYGREGTEPGWHFLTGEPAAIEELTRAVGFRYTHDPKTDEFAHASGIMVLTPAGKLARYFYGVEYPARDLRLGLVEASDEKIGGVVDQVLLFCYGYDPSTGKYTPLVWKMVRAGGVLTLVVMAGGFVWLWRGERRRQTTGEAR